MRDFDLVYEIMEEAFPRNEIRDYDAQKQLLKRRGYSLSPKYDEGDNLIGFIAKWEFEDFIYVEHVAVTSNGRGKGVGSNLLRKLLSSVDKKVFLEVEPVHDEISKRRVKFYERLGFKMNDFYYEQPPLRKKDKWTELKVMSYPDKISEIDFLKYKNEIYKEVYGI